MLSDRSCRKISSHNIYGLPKEWRCTLFSTGNIAKTTADAEMLATKNPPKAITSHGV